jgi:hypothetical protein
MIFWYLYTFQIRLDAFNGNITHNLWIIIYKSNKHNLKKKKNSHEYSMQVKYISQFFYCDFYDFLKWTIPLFSHIAA